MYCVWNDRNARDMKAKIFKTGKNCVFSEQFYMWGFIPNGRKYCAYTTQACVKMGQELDDAVYKSIMQRLKEIKAKLDKIKNSDNLDNSSDRTYTVEDLEREYKELQKKAEHERLHYNVD